MSPKSSHQRGCVAEADGGCSLLRRFVGGLSGLHTYFTGKNRTTYEHFRSRYNTQGNPYDVGCLGNWRQVRDAKIACCPSYVRSLDSVSRLLYLHHDVLSVQVCAWAEVTFCWLVAGLLHGDPGAVRGAPASQGTLSALPDTLTDPPC